MSIKLRSLFVAVLALLAVGAFASSAAATATSVTVTGGNFTATTNGLQVLRTTVGGLIPISVSCTQTATFNLIGGVYTNTTLARVGSLTAVTFTCNDTSLGRPAVVVTNLPRDIGAQLSSVLLPIPASRLVGVLVTVLGLIVQVTLGSTVCRFSGNIGMLALSNSTTGTLLAVTLADVAGDSCNQGIVGGQTYTFNAAPRITAQ